VTPDELANLAHLRRTRDPNGNAPTRLEIVNTGAPALESAHAIQAGAYACSTLIGRGILRTDQEACVKAAMPPEENIRALLVCRGTDNKIYVCNNGNKRGVYPGADRTPLAEIKRYWLTSMETILISTGKRPAPLTSGCRPDK
jgi:hypothetical protein